jgi:hypothetical protein
MISYARIPHDVYTSPLAGLTPAFQDQLLGCLAGTMTMSSRACLKPKGPGCGWLDRKQF